MTQQALTNFIKSLPKSRSQNWKYIDFNRYNFDIFKSSSHNTSIDTKTASITFMKQLLIDPQSPHHRILYNGQVLQSFSNLPIALTNIPLASAKPTNPNVFKTLNQASTNIGSNLIIPRNTEIDEPIYIFNITDAEVNPNMINPKTQIIAEENSRATIIEVYLSLSDNPSFTNAITEVDLAPHANINHIVIQRINKAALHFSDLQVNQSTASTYQGTTLALGGKLNRTTIQINLDASKADCDYTALEFGKGSEQTDIFLNIHHYKPDCHSKTIARGVMNQRAKGSFTGKIVVHEQATKTIATLENKNLLLSPNAEFNTCPELEVYNDDLQCAHGATVGHLDLDALFYLQSRGIPETEAKRLLIDGFIHPCLSKLPTCAIDYIATVLHEH